MSVSAPTNRLVLASGSAARQKMMRSAGLLFGIDPARIDEDAIRDAVLRQGPGTPHPEVAVALAAAKAGEVSSRHPEALAIGSDQILSTGVRILNKPASVDDARETLRELRGRTHWLHSAVALAANGETLWSTVSTARLTMHAFSDAFLDAYLKDVGNDILGCVGAYQIEGAGVRLFEAIEGDHFTILGMPLIPLLTELRRRREIAA